MKKIEKKFYEMPNSSNSLIIKTMSCPLCNHSCHSDRVRCDTIIENGEVDYIPLKDVTDLDRLHTYTLYSGKYRDFARWYTSTDNKYIYFFKEDARGNRTHLVVDMTDVRDMEGTTAKQFEDERYSEYDEPIIKSVPVEKKEWCVRYDKKMTESGGHTYERIAFQNPSTTYENKVVGYKKVGGYHTFTNTKYVRDIIPHVKINAGTKKCGCNKCYCKECVILMTNRDTRIYPENKCLRCNHTHTSLTSNDRKILSIDYHSCGYGGKCECSYILTQTELMRKFPDLTACESVFYWLTCQLTERKQELEANRKNLIRN